MASNYQLSALDFVVITAYFIGVIAVGIWVRYNLVTSFLLLLNLLAGISITLAFRSAPGLVIGRVGIVKI